MAGRAPGKTLLDLLHQSLADLAPGPLGIAVSGGGDSMALLDLAHQTLQTMGFRLHAASVDHGLRAASRAEAETVAAFCTQRGIAHQILTWADGPSAAQSKGNLMDKARQARMALLAEWAKGQGIGTVLLGHTADDQAESFLMNLSRGAGVDGLSGMRPRFAAHGIDWRRPLLAASRAALRGHLQARGIGWIDDPSNENDRFARARARKALGVLAGFGITPDQITASIAHLQTARGALQAQTRLAAQSLTRTEAAALVLDPACLALPPEILRRLVQSAILWLAGGEYPTRGAQLDRLIAALHQGRPAQLAGLRFLRHKGQIWIAPEMRALTASPADFASRWRLSPPPSGLIWRPIGADGLRQRPEWRRLGLPRLALEPAPALWRGDEMLAAPAIEPALTAEFRAEMAQSLADFISLH